MTLRFASARTAARSPLARALVRRTDMQATNDNRDPAAVLADDRLLHAALRHFAAYGLGAAQEARRRAEQAFFAGDRETYDRWLGICRTLDRRLAEETARRQHR